MTFSKLFACSALLVVIVGMAGCDQISSTPTPAVQQDVIPAEIQTSIYPGATDFEMWTLKNVLVSDGILAAPDGSMTADLLSFEARGSLYAFDSKEPVRAGDTFRANVWLWSAQPATVRLRLVRHCESSDVEQFVKILEVGQEATNYTVDGTFINDHQCVRIQLDNPGDMPIELSAWNAQVKKMTE